jgi:hypothetical protein
MDTTEKSPENSNKLTRILFYFFIGQVILGMIGVVGYMLYSYFFG